MIKKLIQIADVHIPNMQKDEEYENGLKNICNTVQKEIGSLKPEECRIVICGDLVHQKNTICNELLVKVSTFLRTLETFCPVYVIAGNHDFVETNSSRMDTLSALFATMQLEHTVFIDGFLHNSYDDSTMEEGDVTTPFSGFLADDNITFALYSIMGEGKYKYENPFTSTRIPKENLEGQTVVGLFHGTVEGASVYNGSSLESPIKLDIFNKCNFVMAGDIHKRQIIYTGDTRFVYSGSPLQQNVGESVLEHGIAVWTLNEDGEYDMQFVDIDNNYGYYNIVINDLSDFEKNKEIITNYD